MKSPCTVAALIQLSPLLIFILLGLGAAVRSICFSISDKRFKKRDAEHLKFVTERGKYCRESCPILSENRCLWLFTYEIKCPYYPINNKRKSRFRSILFHLSFKDKV